MLCDFGPHGTDGTNRTDGTDGTGGTDGPDGTDGTGSLDLVLKMITQTTNWCHKHFGLSRPRAEYDNINGKFAHGRAESLFQFVV